jgi:hypothetical protein
MFPRSGPTWAITNRHHALSDATPPPPPRYQGGEEKLVIALAAMPNRPTCYFYHVFPCFGTPTIYSTWLYSTPLVRVSNSRQLYRALKW